MPTFLQTSAQFNKWVYEPVPIKDPWSEAVGTGTNHAETWVKCLSGSWQKESVALRLQALFKSAGRENRDELGVEGTKIVCMNCDKQKRDKSSARGCWLVNLNQMVDDTPHWQWTIIVQCQLIIHYRHIFKNLLADIFHFLGSFVWDFFFLWNLGGMFCEQRNRNSCNVTVG